MIAKCTKGRSAYGGLAYDTSPGRAEEHRNPHEVAGNVAGRSWRERAHAMDQHARAARPEVTRPIHRTALRAAEEDRQLGDREWRQIAQRYVQEMGFAECPWTAMRHGDEHIHVTVCRVKWNGDLASDANDYRRSHQAARVVERQHGLIDAGARSNPGRPQAHSGERLRADRTHRPPPSDLLRDRIDAAARAGDGSRRSYEAELDRRGVRVAANQTRSGHLNGYRYNLEGHTDADGADVWFKGSQLGRDYRWAAIESRLNRQVARTNERADPRPQQQPLSARATERAELRRRVDQAVRESEGTRPSFEAALRRSGVDAVPNEASTGRMNGYRYRFGESDANAGDSAAWWKGSDLGKDYSWSRLETALEDRRHLARLEARARGEARQIVSRLTDSTARDNPEATRSPSQETAPRLTSTPKGQEPMERETRPAGATDPRRQAKAEQEIADQRPDQDRRGGSAEEPRTRPRRQEQAGEIVRRLRQTRERQSRDDHEHEGQER